MGSILGAKFQFLILWKQTALEHSKMEQPKKRRMKPGSGATRLRYLRRLVPSARGRHSASETSVHLDSDRLAGDDTSTCDSVPLFPGEMQ